MHCGLSYVWIVYGIPRKRSGTCLCGLYQWEAGLSGSIEGLQINVRFPGFLWYIEENRCIMQGKDREKRGCTWEIHKKISGAKRKDEERWT